MTVLEWCCILGALAVGCVAAWAFSGESVSPYTGATPRVAADPSVMLDHPAFLPDPVGEEEGDAPGAADGSQPHGNIDVRNGSDSQAPGNDDSGSPPDNPGSRRGAHR